jgi:hypothetical protein
MRKSALCPLDFRAGLIRFQRCLGEWSRFGAINKANDYSNVWRLRFSIPNSKRKGKSSIGRIDWPSSECARGGLVSPPHRGIGR